MTTNHHPLTPTPELVQQWADMISTHVFSAAAQWGADQELEACCEWLVTKGYCSENGKALSDLRAARRPKPLSETDLALASLEEIIKLTEKLVPRAFVDHSRYDIMQSNNMRNLSAHIENVQRALEALSND
jgi:hypothetical protein